MSVASAPSPDPTTPGVAVATAAGASALTTPGAAAPPVKRRAPIACRRCRRMRSKCVHERGQPPCKACRDAGVAVADCVFPVRGQSDNDRDYRHPRMRSEKAAAAKKDSFGKTRRDVLEGSVSQSPGPGSLMPRTRFVHDWNLLPPMHEIVEAVNNFTRHYFQLGFIHKQRFPQQLMTARHEVSMFLVLGILSISSRFTPSLVHRYGSKVKAAETFMRYASDLALDELYQQPTLERCQAFYLLSIAQQGNGEKNASYINLGIAIRMAILLHLHREETYQITNASPSMIVTAESARRTLWMLHSQDNLHSGPNSPVSLAASDITTLLPCNEEDFSQGREPRSRAALDDTPPAIDNPSLVLDPNRSLFASLMQSHHYWGNISRRAVTSCQKSTRPWDPKSEYAAIARKLEAWERGLPRDHLWSSFLLKGYKSEGQDLAYLGVVMVTRLCNIVLRRAYLKHIINPETKDSNMLNFWSNMSHELFQNVRALYDQVDAQFTGRPADTGVGAQMAFFCAYSCGLFAFYLVKYPKICPDPVIQRDGKMMFERSVSILRQCKEFWPLAERWLEALEKLACDPKAVAGGLDRSMADGKDPVPRVLHPPTVSTPPIKASPITTPKEEIKRLLSPNNSMVLPPPLPPHPNSTAAQTQPPPPIPMYAAIPAGVGMAYAAYDPQAGSYGPDGTFYPAMMLNPSTDGYECQLQYYLENSNNSWGGGFSAINVPPEVWEGSRGPEERW